MRYFTWKVELASNILLMIVGWDKNLLASHDFVLGTYRGM